MAEPIVGKPGWAMAVLMFCSLPLPVMGALLPNQYENDSRNLPQSTSSQSENELQIWKRVLERRFDGSEFVSAAHSDPNDPNWQATLAFLRNRGLLQIGSFNPGRVQAPSGPLAGPTTAIRPAGLQLGQTGTNNQRQSFTPPSEQIPQYSTLSAYPTISEIIEKCRIISGQAFSRQHLKAMPSQKVKDQQYALVKLPDKASNLLNWRSDMNSAPTIKIKTTEPRKIHPSSQNYVKVFFRGYQITLGVC
ncbi:hypothetical protein BJ085DRAFT_32316 [Dimargaris cristalligena]|uniref:Uncharacterized protein n=1 Tax=Dimargaris cristalligena TaxID=215637 RepID=A0A4Q0A3W8_9FUNG|nr:hypothetical protein BJ085DRAFT_32316 [Dimargaris cristalligena]|eukprot:RKP40271.1 hypothetical protein BJ085DRAFT_32316 [Dimargaris cristalligena]